MQVLVTAWAPRSEARALACATRHPEHPAKLILVSTPALTRAASDPRDWRGRRSDDADRMSGDIAAALPAHRVRLDRFAGCGHAVVPDAPERPMALIRDFIAR